MRTPAGLHIRRTMDGTHTLYSAEYDQTYHSMHGALAEARHVFLEGAQVPGMLKEKPTLRVLEIGFGAGLNFLITAAAAGRTETALSYTGLEQAPPALEHFLRLDYGNIDGLQEITDALIRWRSAMPEVVPCGRYERKLRPQCRLTLCVDEATVHPLPPAYYDVVYLDGFSPKANPELWTVAFIQSLFDATAPGGILATFSSAGHVRRALLQAGFVLTRRPGPDGKREVLSATKPAH